MTHRSGCLRYTPQLAAVVLPERCREVPPRVATPQAAGDSIPPGDARGAGQIRAGQAEAKSEQSVNAPGTKAPSGGRQRTKTNPSAETGPIRRQGNHKRGQQRSGGIPVRPQDEFTDTAGYDQNKRAPHQDAGRQCKRKPGTPGSQSSRRFDVTIGRPRESQPARPLGRER